MPSPMSASKTAKLDDVLKAATSIITQQAEAIRKQAPSKDMDKDKLEELRSQRSSKYGIEVLEEGSKLTFPAGGPEKLELYGDPVNLKYPVDTKGRAANARVRFKQFADTYKNSKSKAVVHERIVRAELGFDIEPDYDPKDPLDKLLPSSLRSKMKEAKSKTEKSATKVELRKGFPGEMVEGGIHIHGITRESSTTKTDGGHCHVFVTEQPLDLMIDWGDEEDPHEERFQPGLMLYVDGEDGMHDHAFSGDSLSDDTVTDGEHYHKVYLPSGEVLETIEDGAHSHELQFGTTAFDGMHVHQLELPNGETVTSLTPGQLWELFGMWPQEDAPPLPPASLFALLAPETRGALMAMRSVTNKSSAPEPAEPKVDYDSGTFPALKVPDPKFLMKRLRLQKSAGIISLRRRQSRIDSPQVLVNEMANFDDSFAWGIIKHAEPVAYKLNDIPDDVWESVMPSTREAFKKNNSNAEVFYLPFELVKAFDEPKKLHGPPAGRRFAGKVDLAKDAVTILKCGHCSAPYEALAGHTDLCPDCQKQQVKITKCSRRERAVRLVKSAETEEERIVFGVVLVPNEPDAQDDIYSAEEVRKAAYSFMEVGKGQMKIMHKGELLGNKVAVLETYLSKQEETHGEETFPTGTWFLTSRIYDDAIWKDAKEGVWDGYSIGGDGLREPLN